MRCDESRDEGDAGAYSSAQLCTSTEATTRTPRRLASAASVSCAARLRKLGPSKL